MKLFRTITYGFFLAGIFVISASAQAVQSGKIALIDTKAFDDQKTGIVKFVAGITAVNKEFEPVNQQIQVLVKKSDNLKKELQTMQEQAQKSPPVPVNQQSFQTKADQVDSWEREIKYRQEQGRGDFERRKQAVMGPILIDIGKAMQKYSDQKGYVLILDYSKLEQAGIILAISQTADVTVDFIKYYNALPVSAAATKP